MNVRRVVLHGQPASVVAIPNHACGVSCARTQGGGGMAEITVNGTSRDLGDIAVHTSALDFLRGLRLTGAKEGCAEGECGACAVLVARPDAADPEATQWTALNACLIPAVALTGQVVVTAEGLGTSERLHPVQRALAEHGGSQCGYCTPGFVCSMAAEYYRAGRGRDRLPDGQVDHDERGPNGFDLQAVAGNLCRCTGYRPIRDAAWELGDPGADDPLAERRSTPAPGPVAARLADGDSDFVRPSDLTAALQLLAANPAATIVAGSTDIGVDVNLHGARPRHLVAVDGLPELRRIVVTDGLVEIGAALTLSEVEHLLHGVVPLLDEMWPLFASRLIRNGATVGGNLGTASPIGDLAPAFLALEARLVLTSLDGDREVGIADYFTGYRQTRLRPGELIRAVRVPRPVAAFAAFHKIAKRRYDDISSVAVAFALELREGVVVRARIGLGGVAATPLRAVAAEAALEGSAWSRETVERAAPLLAAAGTPLDDHRASAAYRRAMLGQSLWKLWSGRPTPEVVA
jgi:xanthine dehydrogenase small subunit